MGICEFEFSIEKLIQISEIHKKILSQYQHTNSKP